MTVPFLDHVTLDLGPLADAATGPCERLGFRLTKCHRKGARSPSHLVILRSDYFELHDGRDASEAEVSDLPAGLRGLTFVPPEAAAHASGAAPVRPFADEPLYSPQQPLRTEFHCGTYILPDGTPAQT